VNSKKCRTAAPSLPPTQHRCRPKVRTPRHAKRIACQQTKRLPMPIALTTTHTTARTTNSLHDKRQQWSKQHLLLHMLLLHATRHAHSFPPLRMQPTIRSRARRTRDAAQAHTMLHAHQSFMSLVSMQCSGCTRDGARHSYTD
jgi:hypothetical protein